MALYQYSWAILFAPLLAFVIIVFGTRMWDLASRPKPAREAAGAHGEEHGSHDEHGGHDGHDAHGEHGSDDDNPLVPRLTAGARASAYVGIFIMALACIYSWVLLISSVTSPIAALRQETTVFSYNWFSFYTISFQVDQLALAMIVVVTTVATLVMIYSQGYMANQAGYARFYAYLALFAFSMLVIVFAQNFLVIFIGWEMVGLSSYLLIGFWINKRAKPDEQRPAPASASMQAFVMNRIGDVGFIIGIMMLFVSTGSFNFTTIFARAPQVMDRTTLGIAMLLVFCGAIGKSAQFPLHTWLPSAMEGPTPVSALIHAATMVAAGVYMVARTYPLFLASAPFALQTVAGLGAFTAFFAATIALVQSDFKRVLAFSTISQLGYMFVGLGVGGAEYGVGPGMFHLFTHAFFKALLFLGAGSVIDALHHATHQEVQDMRKMGGLASRMPITALTWLIATLAISGFPGFSGFYSKEFIIGRALEQGDIVIYILTLVTAGLTAFYMLRAFILAFGGEGGAFGGFWGGKYRGEGEPHESPWTMTVPLCILAVFAIFAGYWTGFFGYVDVNPSLPDATLNIGTLFTTPDTWIGVAVSFVGLITAYVMYCRVPVAKLHAAVQNNGLLRFLHNLLYNRYYIDTLYALFVRYIILGISHIEQAFDTYVVDGIVNGVARLVTLIGGEVRHVETGRVQSYMVGFFGGIAVLAVVVFVLFMVRG
jgi:proton-translocating NADH-quinone oxidoreductase chain L